MSIVEKRKELFDDNFNIKGNIEEVISFCRTLTDITGIQCCTYRGEVLESLPFVYNSVVSHEESA